MMTNRTSIEKCVVTSAVHCNTIQMGSGSPFPPEVNKLFQGAMCRTEIKVTSCGNGV